MRSARFHTVFSLAALLGAASSSGSAHAEPSPADRQAATVLFKDGKALFDKGQTAEACRKLEGSHRLDPAAGTLLNLAVCHEKEGRTASAWYEFTDALAAARKDNRPERIKLAEEHIAKLEPQLVRLTIEVPKESDLPDLTVLRDDAVLARAGWGSATPVDPGDHKIEAKAPGKIAWSQSIKVDGSQPNKSVKVPVLAVDPDATKVAAPPPTVAPPPTAAPPPPPPAEPPSTRYRNGVIATAVGGAVIVGAGVVGFVAKSKWDDAQTNCPSARSCTKAGSDDTKSAAKLADAGTTLGVIGAVLAGVGVYFMATAPPAPAGTTVARPSRFQIAPAIAGDRAGAFVSGSF